MSDCPKDYSRYETPEYGSSPPHKLLTSPPKPAPRSMPKNNSRNLEGEDSARHKEKEQFTQHLHHHHQQYPHQYQYQYPHQQHQLPPPLPPPPPPPPPQMLHNQSQFHDVHLQQQLHMQTHIQQQQQQQQFNSIFSAPYQSKPCQSVKPSSSEDRNKEHLPDSYNSHPQNGPLFLQKVAEKLQELQALKHDTKSDCSKHNSARCQAERGHAVLENHFNNHFPIANRPSRSIRMSRNEPRSIFKAICIYVEFDAYKKREIDKYKITTLKSNTLGDLKKVLPTKPDSSLRFFFKNEDNMLEQATHDDQLLYSFKDKDGIDMIICEIVVPKLD